MIKIYKNIKAIKKEDTFIRNIDVYFDGKIYELQITEKDRYCMEKIDSARYDGNGYITTPFGKTEIQNLSTGCKTLILINHSHELNDAIVNIGECGKNVLDIIFSMDNIRVYLDYCSIPNNYDFNKTVCVLYNNNAKNMTLVDFFNKAWRK